VDTYTESCVLNAHHVGTHPTTESVYVGRGSKWGNIFRIGRDGNRDEVIEKYKIWFWKQPKLISTIHELRNRDLVCWCAPLACHADFLFYIANIDEDEFRELYHMNLNLS
jgi:hypothetical protein